MMILNKKKVLICILSIVVFLVVSIFMISSISLFSMSKKSLNIKSRSLSDMINTSSLTRVLSSSNKLKLLEYLVEYEKLKANLSTLSFDELNRFMFLGDYLSNYFSANDLGMSKELLNKVLKRLGKTARVSNGGGSKNILENFDIRGKDSINNNLKKMKKNIVDLYNNNQISTDTYEKLIEKLGNIEYKINLSEIKSKDINIDLDDISDILDIEKKNYSIDADLSAFSDLDKNLLDVKKSLNSILYISNFLNDNKGSIVELDGVNTDVSLNDYSSKIGAVLSNVDIDAFSNLLDLVGEDINDKKAEKINFSKTMSLPKVSVEGTIKDAWNINMKTTGLNFSNILNPIDKSLISSDFLSSQLDSIINVKVPGLDLTNITNSHIVKPQGSKGTENLDEPNKQGKVENSKDSNKKGDSNNATVSKAHNYSNIKKIIFVFFVAGVCVLIVVIIKKNRRKIEVKDREYYEKFISKGFNIDEDMSKSYKQRLIEEGNVVLDIVNRKCLENGRIMTPREIICDFIRVFPDCNKNECYRFLRYFEESAFYNLEVDKNIYVEFDELCKNIIAFTK